MINSPGKFERELYATRYIYDTADGTDEIGSSDELGWFCRFEGKIKGRGPFYATVCEDSQGFVNGQFYATIEELNRAWARIEAAYDRFWEQCEGNEE